MGDSMYFKKLHNLKYNKFKIQILCWNKFIQYIFCKIKVKENYEIMTMEESGIIYQGMQTSKENMRKIQKVVSKHLCIKSYNKNGLKKLILTIDQSMWLEDN